MPESAAKKVDTSSAIVGPDTGGPALGHDAGATGSAEARKRELRKFGLVVGGVFLLIGGWLYWRGRHRWPMYTFSGVGGFLVVFGAVAPIVLGPVYRAWMLIAGVLGWINTRLLLSAIFFLLFMPVSLVMRLFGRDPLTRRFDPRLKSYWVDRPKQDEGPEIVYKRQY
jgi:hypothetical protein